LHGTRPDILPDVNDKLLSNLGTSVGDVICLKKASITWWNRLDAKHKQSNTSILAAALDIQEPPAKKQVSYQKKYYNRGGCWFSRPPMWRDNDTDNGLLVDHDHDLLYFCDTQRQ
ncbi:hypothetical protein V8B97DRAFT_1846840, partial [Scleroderma yunnanense]